MRDLPGGAHVPLRHPDSFSPEPARERTEPLGGDPHLVRSPGTALRSRMSQLELWDAQDRVEQRGEGWLPTFREGQSDLEQGGTEIG